MLEQNQRKGIEKVRIVDGQDESTHRGKCLEGTAQNSRGIQGRRPIIFQRRVVVRKQMSQRAEWNR